MKIKKVFSILLKISVFKTLYYSIKFKAKIIVGKGTVINLQKCSKITILKGGVLFLGYEYTLPQKTVLDIYKKGEIKISGRVSINNGTKIVIGENAILSIGNKTYINEHSRIQCRKRIDIGEKCAIAWNVNILDTDEHTIVIGGIEQLKYADVVIGNNVWIGCNAIILKGVNIEDNVVIGAGSVVTKNIRSKTLNAGNPTKVLKENVSWF